MSIRVITIDKNFPQHWEYAKRNGFWDLQAHWKALQAGDHVYFWVTGSPGRIVGSALVTTPVQELPDGEPHHWDPDDPRRGAYTHRIGLTGFSDLDEQVDWGEVRAATGAGGRLNPVTAIPDAGITWFERRVGGRPVDASDDEARSFGWDTYWEATDIDAVLEDRREFALQAVALRRGARAFRDALLTAFDRRCAVSGCAVVELLEAAHISPYKGDHTDQPDNGLLLRADLHTLFDLDLLTIRATDLTVAVAPDVDDPLYRGLEGRTLRSRSDRVEPNRGLLAVHNAKCTWLHRVETSTTSAPV